MSKALLEIKKLNGVIDGKEVISDITLTLNKGETIALMGPNGSGKSSLAQIIMGNPEYTIKGDILCEGEDITKKTTDKRALQGIYLAFQYPYEIPGLNLTQYLRATYNARLPKNKQLNVFEFRQLLRTKLKDLDLSEDFLNRNLNEGFSGGEKKRMEILQLLLFKPKIVLLDETDSGLDVDALKIVFNSIKEYKKTNKDIGIIIISHYKRVYDYITPDRVIVLKKGKIEKTGDASLINSIEEKGYNN